MMFPDRQAKHGDAIRARRRDHPGIAPAENHLMESSVEYNMMVHSRVRFKIFAYLYLLIILHTSLSFFLFYKVIVVLFNFLGCVLDNLT